MRRGRRFLAGSVRRAALPYGYTLVTWTSGGVLIEGHGPPDLVSAYLFLFGALAGLGLLALAAGRETQEHDHPPHASVAASGLAATCALGAAGLLAELFAGRAAYFLVAFGATVTYFLIRSSV